MRVFIIGFMGAGKSHWGRIWADVSGMSFFDLDELIELDEQLTIDQIFEKKGEPYFRQREAALLHSLLDYDNCIIACGGGTPCFNDNMKWMNDHAFTVFIKASPMVLLENMLDEIEKRPIFKHINKEELLTFIRVKLKERDSFYAAAKLTISIGDLKKSTIQEIQKLMSNP